MDNFKLNFLSWGQLKTSSLDNVLLPLFKMLPYYKVFLVSLFLPLLVKYSGEIILISVMDAHFSPFYMGAYDWVVRICQP